MAVSLDSTAPPKDCAFAVLGDPVSHSLSPPMHNAGFAAQALHPSYRYGRMHVRPCDLDEALRRCFEAGMRGLNLTVPHKRAALRSLESLSARAEAIGAVNTLTRGTRGWVGHNTDAPGFVRALQELGGAEFPSPARARILGAGGAALAVVQGLREAYPELELALVTRRPESLAAAWGQTPAMSYEAFAREAPAPAGSPNLWVNTTIVGMAGGVRAFPRPLPLERLGAASRVVDIVYPRPEGGLLDLAAARGAAVQDGRAMLLWQGVVAQERWLKCVELSPNALRAMRAVLDG